MASGLIFNVQRYSIHDGPGIRTVVFFKGCPLRCRWCHNPEGMARESELMHDEKKCLACGACVKNCPSGAIFLGEQNAAVDRRKCNRCFRCTTVCPAGALSQVGRLVTVEEVVSEVDKDRVFFTESGGGVTLSGGEPLIQPEFLVSLLGRLKEEGFHTAVETSGQGSPVALQEAAAVTDLFLYDLKLADPGKCLEYTGASGENILRNLRLLAKLHKNILVRIPVIPTVNDGEQAVKEIGDFLRQAEIKRVALLPYHRMGIDKYCRLGLKYSMPDISPPGEKRMQAIREVLASYGLQIEEHG